MIKNLANLNLKSITRLANYPTAIKSYNEIPGPKTLPIIGSLLNIKSFGGAYDFLEFRDFQDQLQAHYGDMVKWEIFTQKYIYVFNPELVKEVYKADSAMPLRPVAEPMVKLHKKIGLSADLINSQGEQWRKMRSLSNPVMAKPQTIHSYLENHNEVANDLVEFINAKFNHNHDMSFKNFDKVVRLLTLEYVSELAFDHRIRCVDSRNGQDKYVEELVNAIEVFFIQLGRLSFSFPFWQFYPTKDWKKFEKAGTFIYDVVRGYIKYAQDMLDNDESMSKSKKKSILAEFLSRKEKYNLCLEDVVSIMTDFLIAGVDTTSNSLYYILYELSINQDIQDKLYDEIQSIVGKDTNITESNIENFRYLKCIFKESMRLHSTVPANARILSNDLALDNYLIPKGTRMLFCNSYITRSERFFRNALKFDPSRWESGKEQIGQHPYSALPFGFGPRACIGRRIAEQEIYLTLIKLIQNFKIYYDDETAPGLVTGLIASPDRPLNLRFLKR